MKLTLTFKDPDAVSMAIKCAEKDNGRPMTDEERAKFAAMVDYHIRWGEYVDITFDTETGTVTIGE